MLLVKDRVFQRPSEFQNGWITNAVPDDYTDEEFAPIYSQGLSFRAREVRHSVLVYGRPWEGHLEGSDLFEEGLIEEDPGPLPDYVGSFAWNFPTLRLNRQQLSLRTQATQPVDLSFFSSELELPILPNQAAASFMYSSFRSRSRGLGGLQREPLSVLLHLTQPADVAIIVQAIEEAITKSVAPNYLQSQSFAARGRAGLDLFQHLDLLLFSPWQAALELVEATSGTLDNADIILKPSLRTAIGIRIN